MHFRYWSWWMLLNVKHANDIIFVRNTHECGKVFNVSYFLSFISFFVVCCLNLKEIFFRKLFTFPVPAYIPFDVCLLFASRQKGNIVIIFWKTVSSFSSSSSSFSEWKTCCVCMQHTLYKTNEWKKKCIVIWYFCAGRWFLFSRRVLCIKSIPVVVFSNIVKSNKRKDKYWVVE